MLDSDYEEVFIRREKESMNDALLGSVISAMSTGLGAVPILFMRKISHRLRDILLAYAAGIMTSASVYNLIPEALGQSNLFVLAFGIMLGSLVLLVLEMRIPPRRSGKSGENAIQNRRQSLYDHRRHHNA